MFKRMSLVWRRPDLTMPEFVDAWLGEHADYARRLPGLREYLIDIVEDPAPQGPHGIATVRFDSRHACETAFAKPGLRQELIRTREDFAAAVQVLYVEERVVYREGSGVC